MRRLAVLAAFVVSAAFAPSLAAATTHLVSGRVTNHQGDPVAGVNAGMCRVEGTFYTCHTGVSDQNGAYSVSVEPGSYRVNFRDPAGIYPEGYWSQAGFTEKYDQATQLVVADADVTGIDIACPPVYRISGKVTDPHGKPVADVQVSACTPNECGNLSARTSAAGTYVLGVQAGTYTVEAFKPSDFISTFYSKAGGAPSKLNVHGDVGSINIRFAAALHVAGTLRQTSPQKSVFLNIYACAVGGGTCYNNGESAPGPYRIAVTRGTYVVSFLDNAGSVVPGYWSSHGLVATSDRATPVAVTSDRSAVSVTLAPLVVATHAGTSRSGTFRTSPLTIKANAPFILRVALGRGFAGMKVVILGAAGTSATNFGSFKHAATVTVAADGYAYFSTKVTGYKAFKATYQAPTNLLYAPVSSQQVVVRGT